MKYAVALLSCSLAFGVTLVDFSSHDTAFVVDDAIQIATSFTITSNPPWELQEFSFYIDTENYGAIPGASMMQIGIAAGESEPTDYIVPMQVTSWGQTASGRYRTVSVGLPGVPYNPVWIADPALTYWIVLKINYIGGSYDNMEVCAHSSGGHMTLVRPFSGGDWSVQPNPQSIWLAGDSGMFLESSTWGAIKGTI